MARASAAALAQLRETEVENLRVLRVAAVNDHQIFRLQIAMDDARLVRLGQPRADLNEEARRARKSPRPLAPEQRREIVALDELHHEIERAVGLAEVERLNDVRVIELADRLRLEAKTTNRFGLFCGVGRQHLHRGGLAQVQVLDAIDDAHPARPDAAPARDSARRSRGPATDRPPRPPPTGPALASSMPHWPQNRSPAARDAAH